ncbi:MAG TPA: hypothetical protein VFR67_04215 [Pilimelia sp.]|nr:hypothetical protein [Pilimelia sp.]
MRPRVILVIALAAVVLGGTLVVSSALPMVSGEDRIDRPNTAATGSSQAPAPEPVPRPLVAPEPLPPTLAARPVSVKVDGFYSWALLDRKSGRISGSKNITATNSTESMVKIWIVSDYLRRVAAKRQRPSSERLRQASTAIRDSNDNSAQSLYDAGGGNSVIRRMISVCDLTETTVYSGWWSRTQISARDAVRLGACVGDGRAAGPQWTAWVLREMRLVRGTTAKSDQRATSGGGRWGIIDGLPQEIIDQGVGIKNGWTAIGADGKWHINCLAVAKEWVLAVLMRYPVTRGLPYGANVCKSVAEQLVVQPAAGQG